METAIPGFRRWSSPGWCGTMPPRLIAGVGDAALAAKAIAKNESARTKCV
jgi:hypothetical protein